VAHGFVVFSDGNVKAQLAPPDMRLPIGYALAFPDRLPGRTSAEPLAGLGAASGAVQATLSFELPDLVRFPALGLAYQALQRGGTVPAALSAANEVAVEAFVAGRIGFTDIADVIAEVVAASPDEPLDLAAVRAADRRARESAARGVAARSLSSESDSVRPANALG
jgi:1-deoxy-D-xylulose-5-phosphate reductoisomerase